MIRFRYLILVAVACIGLILGPHTMAQESREHLTAGDIFKLEYAGDPQISPDGQKILYLHQFADVMTDSRKSNIWIINFDGTDDQPITTGDYNDNSARWSPDGTLVAYISDRSGSPQIYIRRMDNGQTRQITSVDSPPSGITWSPDGKQIAFGAVVAPAPLNIATVPQPPSGAKWAPFPKVYDRLLYRFNGRGYLKPGYAQSFVISVDGGNPRQVSSGNFENLGTGLGFRGQASWSADGLYLLASSNHGPNPDVDGLDSEVYEYALANGAVRALTDRRGPDNSAVASPNNKWIAYTGFDDHNQFYQTTDLLVMNRDGTNSHVLSTRLDRDVKNPKWASDSSGIYFVYDDQGDTKLGFYPLNGELQVLASHLGSGSRATPDSPAYSVAKDGSYAFTYTDPLHPPEIAVGRKGSSSVRTITSVSKALVSQKRLGQVEEIWFKSSLDNRRIHGWIMKPPDFDPGKKYPMILSIHGGPQNNFGDRFDIEMQIWAGSGYVILYVNPRGSDSYGAEFGNVMMKAYPGNDFYDLISGVDTVISRGYVDPDNLFVTGVSGGAVLTCWVTEHTNRFRAAVPVSPAVNWTSYILTSDVMPVALGGLLAGVLPWDDKDGMYSRLSPITWIKGVKTPTMIMTGEEDFRTPISEVEQYYQALKILGIESVMVRIPDDSHGVYQHPSHEMEKVIYIESWFEKHKTTRRSAQ